MFLYSKWRLLPIHIRIELADKLGIKKHGPTHVRDNVIESDGYLIADVESALAVENLQFKLGTTQSDPEILWDIMIHGKPIELVSEPIKRKVGRPKKNA